jgi:exonuclease SbcD
MRILHTADWHLGATLHELSREREHAAFLDWLLDTLETERIDAVLIAGDLFDHGNPSSAAQRLWYRFVARARARFPLLDIVAIGGNHDSPARLEAPVPLLDELGVTVVASFPWRGEAADVARLVIPLGDRRGAVEAWVAAVPYVRPIGVSDQPTDDGRDVLIEAVREAYERVLGEGRRLRQPGQALVAMGHAYLVGGILSELSERKVLCGNQHPLPVDLFPDDVAYVALGHLHLAQTVGGRAHVRYSGSPLPLAVTEAGYRHQVLVVELTGERVTDVRSLAVPRTVAMIRVPDERAAETAWPRERVLAELARLPLQSEAPDREAWPFLDVTVDVSAGPEPDLRGSIEAALSDRAARLVRLVLDRGARAVRPVDEAPTASLQELGVEQVFRLCYERRCQGEIPDDLLAAFHDLREELGRQEVAP